MNILKKRSAESDTLLELRFNKIGDFLYTEKKAHLKNYWLQKKEIRDQVKEHDAKLDEIARFVTKYINNRKLQDKG